MRPAYRRRRSFNPISLQKLHLCTFQVIWTKNGRPYEPDLDGTDGNERLLYDNATIVIQRANSDEHQGKYACTATNKAGTASKDFVVQLSAPPTVDRGEERRTVKVDDYVMLTCNPTSGITPNTKVKWRIGNQVRFESFKEPQNTTNYLRTTLAAISRRQYTSTVGVWRSPRRD